MHAETAPAPKQGASPFSRLCDGLAVVAVILFYAATLAAVVWL